MNQRDLKYGGWTAPEDDEYMHRDPLGRTHEQLMEKAYQARENGNMGLWEHYKRQAEAAAHKAIQREPREPNRYIFNSQNRLEAISGQDFNPQQKGKPNGRTTKGNARPARRLRR